MAALSRGCKRSIALLTGSYIEIYPTSYCANHGTKLDDRYFERNFCCTLMRIKLKLKMTVKLLLHINEN